MKKFLVLLLTLALVMTVPVLAHASDEPEYAPTETPIYVAAEPVDDEWEWSRHFEDEWLWNLNLIIEGLGVLIFNEETSEVIVTNRPGDSLSFIIYEAGGFYEDGMIWLPPDFIIEFIDPLIFVRYVAPRVPRIDLTIWNAENFADVREIAHTTDLPHGEIGTYYVRFMSEYLPGRSPFSYAELDAAIWLVEELLAMGHDFDNIEVQEFTYWDLFEYYEISVWWNAVTWSSMIGEDREHLLREDRVSQNVVLTLPGQSERKIIIGAHYDSLMYPGASDNASGTALLLESALRMLELDHYYTIVYVFFGAEEVGLVGAHYFYALLSESERNNIVMMINADVLIEGPYLVYGAGGMPVIEDEEYLQNLRIRLIDTLVEMVNTRNEEWREQMQLMEDEIQIEIFEDEHDYIAGEYVLYEVLFDVLIFDEFAPEDVTAEDFYWILDLPASSVVSWAFDSGLIDIDMDEYALMVSNIAAELNSQHDFELITVPENIGLSSDQLVFLNAGHTVVMLAGFERLDNVEYPGFFIFQDEFTMTVLHSPQDEFYYIEARWPGMIFNNMRGFGLLLEGILTAR